MAAARLSIEEKNDRRPQTTELGTRAKKPLRGTFSQKRDLALQSSIPSIPVPSKISRHSDKPKHNFSQSKAQSIEASTKEKKSIILSPASSAAPNFDIEA